MLSVSVPADAPVKLVHLRLHNASRNARTATLTWYAELTLGDQRSHTASTIVTRVHAETGMLIADNAMSEHFGGGVVFMDTSAPQRVVTGDRTAFIGRNRTLATARGTQRDRRRPRWRRARPVRRHPGRRNAGRRGDAETCRSCSVTPPTSTPRVHWRRGSAIHRRRASPDDRAVTAWNERLSRVQVRTPDRGAST